MTWLISDTETALDGSNSMWVGSSQILIECLLLVVSLFRVRTKDWSIKKEGSDRRDARHLYFTL